MVFLIRTIASIALLALAAACAHQAPSPTQQATLLADKGRYEEASRVLRAHLVEHPDAVAERRLLIRLLAAQGQMDAARAEVEMLRKLLGPGDPRPWLELGHAFELTHDYEQALSMYDQAADTAPRDPAGPLTGGLRAARWGEVELARPRLEEALRRDPSNASAWHALGLVCLHLEDFTAAQVAYDSGLHADPQSIENRIGLASLALTRGHMEEALRQYDAILKDRPKFGDAHLGRSFALMKLGRYAEARDTLETGYRLGANPAVVSRQRALLDRLSATSPSRASTE
ncbi:MAG TPA: tetratricopeptide repeat protein [Polyangiaceae bacterium]|nr:tetratricopeptide repeat protein [Polyangiaceae bacterium]